MKFEFDLGGYRKIYDLNDYNIKLIKDKIKKYTKKQNFFAIQLSKVNFIQSTLKVDDSEKFFNYEHWLNGKKKFT